MKIIQPPFWFFSFIVINVDYLFLNFFVNEGWWSPFPQYSRFKKSNFLASLSTQTSKSSFMRQQDYQFEVLLHYHHIKFLTKPHNYIWQNIFSINTPSCFCSRSLSSQHISYYLIRAVLSDWINQIKFQKLLSYKSCQKWYKNKTSFLR